MPGEDSMSQLERDLTTGVARMNRSTGTPYATTSWAAVDLEPYKRGEIVITPPMFLHRTDGKALIYPGRPHVFFGESESLKSWAGLLACRSVVAAGFKALYVDMEASEPLFVERCRKTGIPDGAIGNTLRYIRPIQPLLGDAAADFWLYEMEDLKPALVVLDGVTELYELQGWDINKATDAAAFHKLFAFSRGGVASVAIDHTSKDAGRGVLGSQHKRAGLDGAEYEFRSKVRGGRGGQSLAEVSVTKDRHGYVREWTKGLVGTLEVAVDGVSLQAPTLMDLIDPRDDAMGRVLEYLRESPGASKRAIAAGARLGNDPTADALSALAMQGKIRNDGTPSRGSWVVIDQ
jgi:hypothetical protein